MGGTKLERFLSKNQHTQRKVLRIGLLGRCQKLGIILETNAFGKAGIFLTILDGAENRKSICRSCKY